MFSKQLMCMQLAQILKPPYEILLDYNIDSHYLSTSNQAKCHSMVNATQNH